MSGPAFAPGLDPRVELLRVGREQRPVLILDDLLTGAESLVDFTADSAILAPVKAAANFYPGVRAPAPSGYVQALITALRPHLAEVFGAADGRAHVTCALSMATLPADQASLAQRLPHIDTTAPTQLAILHYLCGPEHGGTAFYRHRATGFETIGPERGPTYLAALRQQMAEGAADRDGYITASDPLYEQTAVVASAFNRIVVYASNLLHAGVLPDHPASADPRVGRLTANTFFRSEIA